MIKVGVVGFGLAAKDFHLPFIQQNPDFKLVAISSSQQNLICQQYPDITVYATAELMLNNADTQLIVICSPNATHVPLAITALNQGKSVVIEKPIALTVAELVSLEQAEQASTGRVFGYHNRRWDGDFVTIKALIAENTLGKVRVFESRFSRYRPKVSAKWKEAAGSGTGLWNDLGPHLIDQSLQLFGTPNAITARIQAQRENASTDDYFHVQLHYDGLEVILISSNFDNGPHARFHIEGESATYIKNAPPQNPALTETVNADPKNIAHEPEALWGRLYTPSASTAIPNRVSNYGAFYAAVSQCMNHDHAFPVTFEQMMECTKLLELARTSASMGKTMTIRKYRN